jgi:hypothetical protein
MPNRVVRRKKGGFVPTGKSLRDARERRQMIARIQEEERLEDLFPDPPVGPPGSNDSIENLERRLAALREQDLPELNPRPERRVSVGDRPLYNSGSVVADHPREPERPLTLEEMNLPDLNLRPQRRGSVGGIKRKSRKHKKHSKSKRKSKHNKKKHTRHRVNKKLKRNSRTRRR